MNAAIIAIVGILWFYLVYRFYGRHLDRKVIKPDDSRETPANSLYDGVDYVPAHPAVLFGHHFSSIAGAGPIVGPILAYSLFGWVPALLWILLGTAFIGMVHDYFSLMTSVRNRGVSIAEVAEEVISKTAKWLFSIFVWFALVLVVAVFSVITAKTLEAKPQIAIPTLGLIVLAIFFGLAVYRLKVRVIPATLIAWGFIFGLVWLGYLYPIRANFNTWFYVFLLYAFIASGLPVWFLLQPRDYLSMTILFVGLLVGYAGLFALHPHINGPVLHSFSSTQGPLVPMLFIIIACGAISGFHSLVASGTTAKQLKRESHGRIVGSGAMIFEGILALLVLLLMAGALKWGSGSGNFFFGSILSKKGPIVAFGTGFGKAVSSLGISLSLATAFGILMLNAFVLTSLDTAVRLSRFVFQEAIAKDVKPFNNRWLASFIGVAIAWAFAATNSWKVIWPAFGGANQLVAALSLFTISAYLAGVKKPVLYSLIPALFMWLVTESALFYLLVFKFAPNAFKDFGKLMLALVTVVLIVLGLMVGYEALSAIKRKWKLKNG